MTAIMNTPLCRIIISRLGLYANDPSFPESVRNDLLDAIDLLSNAEHIRSKALKDAAQATKHFLTTCGYTDELPNGLEDEIAAVILALKDDLSALKDKS